MWIWWWFSCRLSSFYTCKKVYFKIVSFICRYFLCLFAGVPQESVKLPEPILNEESHVKNIPRETTKKKRKKGERRPAFKSREWILARKERARRKGKETRPDTKYTGRRRRKIVI